MDLLKRNWFWFVMGALVLACLSFYGLGVWAVRAENDALRSELEGKQGQFDTWQTAWTKDQGRIPGDPQIQAYQAHAETLRTLLADAQNELKAPQRWQAAKTEDKWRVELLEGYSKQPDVAAPRYNDRLKELFLPDPKPSGHAQMNFLAAGPDAFQFAKPPLSVSSSPDDILREGKRLMLQLELVRILNESRVLRLPQNGISFDKTGSSTSSDGSKTSQLPLRDPLKDDERATYPFRLQVDIDLRELPVLLDQMNRSSFNLNVTGLQIDRLDPNADVDKNKRVELVDGGLVSVDRHNEIIRLTLVCEAVEFLFGETRKGSKR